MSRPPEPENPGYKDPDERVSLAGLDPEEALRALLAVKPEADEADGNVGASRDDLGHEGAED